jgi:hypothetical protein
MEKIKKNVLLVVKGVKILYGIKINKSIENYPKQMFIL